MVFEARSTAYLFRSQMIAVRSLEVVTATLYGWQIQMDVIESEWPNKFCLAPTTSSDGTSSEFCVEEEKKKKKKKRIRIEWREAYKINWLIDW